MPGWPFLGTGGFLLLALPFLARGVGKPGMKLKRQKAVPEGKVLACFGGMLREDLPTGHLSYSLSTLSSSNHGFLAATSSSSQPPSPEALSRPALVSTLIAIAGMMLSVPQSQEGANLPWAVGWRGCRALALHP